MSTETDEKEAPSAIEDDIIIEDEIAEEEPEQIEDAIEPEVDAAEENDTEAEEVKQEDAEKEPEPRVPYKRVKQQSDKIKELYAKIEELEAKTKPKEPDYSDRPKRPSEKDFDYDTDKYQAAVEKYEDDLLEYKLNQRIKAEEQKKAKQRAEELRNEFSKNASELFEKDKEYQKALIQADEDGEDLSIPSVVSEAMLESEVGHLIERELVVNREEMLPKIRGMSDRQRLVFLGRIEAQILSKQEGKQQPKPKEVPVSKAPKPQSEVRATTTKANDDAELKKIYRDFEIE